MTTVASSTGCSEQSLSWILNASTHGNLAAEAIRIDLGYAWQVHP